MIPNPDGDEPPYIQEVDDDQNPLYWNITEETQTTTQENGTPAFVQAIETVEVEVPNDVEILKTTVGDLSELLGYSNNQNVKALTVIDNLDNRLDQVESLIEQGDNVIALNTKVGNLEELLLRTVPTDEVEINEPTSLVQAINILDTRTRWQDLD